MIAAKRKTALSGGLSGPHCAHLLRAIDANNFKGERGAYEGAARVGSGLSPDRELPDRGHTDVDDAEDDANPNYASQRGRPSRSLGGRHSRTSKSRVRASHRRTSSTPCPRRKIAFSQPS